MSYSTDEGPWHGSRPTHATQSLAFFPSFFFFFFSLCLAYNGGFRKIHATIRSTESVKSRFRVISSSAACLGRKLYLLFKVNQVIGIQQQLNKTDSNRLSAVVFICSEVFKVK